MEPEYEDLTPEQEEAKVKTMTPREQAEYRELKQFHQHQAESNKEMTGMSKIIQEWTNAWPPGIPTDLIRWHVQVEPPECQELQKITREQRTHALLKQDDIPRSDQPGMTKGYYLYVEDDQGYMVEQRDGTLVPDTETERLLPTDQITEAEAATYQVLEGDDDIDDDTETISSTSTAYYDREEVKMSLTNTSEVFHAIAHKYEKLMATVPHMTRVQAAQVVARLPVMPILKQEPKIKKKEPRAPPEKMQHPLRHRIHHQLIQKDKMGPAHPRDHQR